jgi:hypothetical protein
LGILNAYLLGVLLVMSAKTPRSGDSFRLVPCSSLGHLKLIVGGDRWTGRVLGRERLLLLKAFEDLQHTLRLQKPILAFQNLHSGVTMVMTMKSTY